MIINDTQADFLNNYKHAVRRFADAAEQVALRASSDFKNIRELVPTGHFGPNHQDLMTYQVSFGEVQAYRNSMVTAFPPPIEFKDADERMNFYRELDGMEKLVRSGTIRVFIEGRNYEV